MHILSPVHELAIIGAYDVGVPNRERVVLRPTESLNLAEFALILTTQIEGGLRPLADQFFWFGEKWVAPPAWIVIFTGPGSYREGAHESTGEPVLELHWGRPTAVLHLPDVVVALIRIGALSSFYTAQAQIERPQHTTRLPRRGA